MDVSSRFEVDCRREVVTLDWPGLGYVPLAAFVPNNRGFKNLHEKEKGPSR